MEDWLVEAAVVLRSTGVQGSNHSTSTSSGERTGKPRKSGGDSRGSSINLQGDTAGRGTPARVSSSEGVAASKEGACGR